MVAMLVINEFNFGSTLSKHFFFLGRQKTSAGSRECLWGQQLVAE